MARALSDVERQDVGQWQPLIFYGDSGSGKSFVALSIADRWKLVDDSEPVVTTAADVARLFQPSRLAAELDSYSRRLRTTSLLVIDDIDQLNGRELACSWLVGVFDRRQAFGLPSIVATKSMTTLRSLPSRLFSRLAGGLPVRCALPAHDTRRWIIESTMQQEGEEISHDLVSSMVDRSSGMSVTGIRNSVLTRKSSLSCDARDDVPDDFPKRCMAAVARRFGVRVADIKGPSRRKNTVKARSIAMFLIREFTALSLVDTGQCFQNRDHTTVRHACQKIKKLLTTDQQIQDAVRSICMSLNQKYDATWSAASDINSLDDKCA